MPICFLGLLWKQRGGWSEPSPRTKSASKRPGLSLTRILPKQKRIYLKKWAIWKWSGCRFGMAYVSPWWRKIHGAKRSTNLEVFGGGQGGPRVRTEGGRSGAEGDLVCWKKGADYTKGCRPLEVLKYLSALKKPFVDVCFVTFGREPERFEGNFELFYTVKDKF